MAIPEPGAADEPQSGSPNESEAVLGKLEALLGRLRGPDAPAAHPIAVAAIPVLTEPVSWSSPAPAVDPAVPGGTIPTLTEPVELQGSPQIAPVDPAADPAPQTVAPEPRPLPGARVDSQPGSQPDSQPYPQPQAQAQAQQESPSVPAFSEADIRARVYQMLDPQLESRLCERALADLDRTLVDLQSDYQAELAAWRDEQSSRIRDQVRGEVERAVDEVVHALLSQSSGRTQGDDPA